MASRPDSCPACQGTNVYATLTGANGGHGPTLLPGLGAFFKPAKIEVRMCLDCGHLSFFAERAERERARENHRWTRVR
jgi:hypothetical protein